ncbi:glutathionylspermidine synthase family protein [Siculibacillus lacustris]|uniref:Glutathionylspermidine synthase family protein n=2 Tax=Siculibacillus lacustris TaxID=1549641 RepID=A0A4Q9VJ98_9HYPH|nr:glutathionylspermidine synthase family protein [Siculibacillus lacustris]TBW35254.1 glutathionylspermidine synthase family protein [Siculibacillus lacustris]
MKRLRLRPRPDAAARHAEIGFDFAEIDGTPYWDESVAYRFTLAEIEDDIEAPTAELAALCEDLVDRVVADERLLAKLRLPAASWDAIRASRRRGDPSLYGRFDLVYDGHGPAKLLEFNADTPTALFEAAVVQWTWLSDGLESGFLPAGADQYNSLHEKLIERLRTIVVGGSLHLAGMTGAREDAGTLAYLADCATQAGLAAAVLDVAEIGLSGDRFVDLADRPIDTLFKLYPWEWIFAEDFGRSPGMATTRFVEPAWKAILSNKGMLALLWEAAPGHPNLLPAFFDDDPRRDSLHGRYALKPLYSREGANVMLVDGGRLLQRTEGSYGAEGSVVQALALLPNFDGGHPVLGSWLVGDAPCGLGIREDTSLVTGDRSRFVPHVIAD